MIYDMTKKFLSKIGETTKDSAQLFIAEGAGLFFGMLIYFLRTRYLSVDDVGQISYIVSIVSVTSVFFTFGIDNSGGRMVLREEGELNKRRCGGALMTTSFILFAAFDIFMLLFSVVLELLHKPDSALLIRLAAPFIGYNLILLVYNEVCYARGAIRQASIQLFFYYISYFFLIIVLNYFKAYTLKVAVISEFGLHFLTVFIPAFVEYRLYFKPDRQFWEKLKMEEKERGLAVYLSRIVFLPAFNISTFILGIFHPMSSVAFYSLCNTISSPISVVGESIGKAMYRKMNNKREIQKKALVCTVGITLGFAALIWAAGSFVIIVLLGKDYRPMLTLLPLTVVSYVIRGITSMYTYFMNANGMAKEQKVVAYVGLAVSLSANFGLIIPFGAMGGVYASIVILIAILSVRMYFCHKRRLQGRETDIE